MSEQVSGAGRIEELWARVVSGETLSDSEQRELCVALSEDAELRRRILDDERFDGLLSNLGRSARDEGAFARRFLDRIEAEADRERFVVSVERRLRAEGQAPRPHRRRAFVLTASAGLAVAAGALLLLRAAPEPARGPVPQPATDRIARAARESPRGGGDGAAAATMRLGGVRGEAFLVGSGPAAPAREGGPILANVGIMTAGGGSMARVHYPDGSRIELSGDTAVGHLGSSGGGKTVFVTRGTVRAEVVRQPPGQPMIIVTPHSQATVLGTRFEIAVTETSTRLAVAEGLVRFARVSGADAVDVAADQYVVAALGAGLSVASRTRGDVLLVVGSGLPRPSDQLVRHRIERLGFAVRVRSPGPRLREEATTSSLVVVSSTIVSMDAHTQLRDLTVPVIVWEPWLFDDLGMTAAPHGVESGWVAGKTDLVIKDTEHALAAGLEGSVQVHTIPGEMTWGIPGPYASWVATLSGDPARAVLFAYDRGTPMPGLVAPARRVGLFLYDDTASGLTENGWSLFDAAVRWGTELAPQ